MTVVRARAGDGCVQRRKSGTRIRWTVLHIADGRRAGVERWFSLSQAERAAVWAKKLGKPATDSAVRALSQPTCAHYLVCYDGTVVQFAEEADKVYHARDVNSSSIGIEHEGFDESPELLTEAQLRASAELVRDIHARHGLPLTRGDVAGLVDGWVGHRDVPGTAKPCPGARFPWAQWESYLRGEGG